MASALAGSCRRRKGRLTIDDSLPKTANLAARLRQGNASPGATTDAMAGRGLLRMPFDKPESAIHPEHGFPIEALVGSHPACAIGVVQPRGGQWQTGGGPVTVGRNPCSGAILAPTLAMRAGGGRLPSALQD